MYITKGYGFTVEKIDMSCPSDMEPYVLAKQYEENQNDIKQWQLGQYMCAAISVIGKGKYPKEPMFQIKDESEDSKEEMAALELKKRAFSVKDRCLPPSPR